MTQAELASALNVAPNSVARWERDEVPILQTTEYALRWLASSTDCDRFTSEELDELVLSRVMSLPRPQGSRRRRNHYDSGFSAAGLALSEMRSRLVCEYGATFKEDNRPNREWFVERAEVDGRVIFGVSMKSKGIAQCSAALQVAEHLTRSRSALALQRSNTSNEVASLKLWHGFRADTGNLRFFVEVQPDGWVLRLFDKTARKWTPFRVHVSSAEEGKTIGRQEAETRLGRPVWGLTWTEYGR